MSTFTSLDQLKLNLVITVHRLIEPLRQLQVEEAIEYGTDLPKRTDLLLGELMMVALLFSSSDNVISELETGLINEISQALQGADVVEAGKIDYMEMYRGFIEKFPQIRLTLDHIPQSVYQIQEYDKKHMTNYAEDAKLLFLDFASAIVHVDQEVGEQEKIALANFETVLFSDEERRENIAAGG